MGSICLEKLQLIEILYKPGEPPFFSTSDDIDVVDLKVEKSEIMCYKSQKIPAFSMVSFQVSVVNGVESDCSSQMIEPSSKLVKRSFHGARAAPVI